MNIVWCSLDGVVVGVLIAADGLWVRRIAATDSVVVRMDNSVRCTGILGGRGGLGIGVCMSVVVMRMCCV